MRTLPKQFVWHRWILMAALVAVTAVYWPGLHGAFLFDDYPNIVDNPGVQIHDATLPSLAKAALSSPSSQFKRPLASLSFAANYLAAGLDPYWMKLTNLVIHLLNGWLVFILARSLLRIPLNGSPSAAVAQPAILGALIAGGWMLLPINLTGVLYVVQRMESMANLFVLIGLIGYVAGRRRMLTTAADNSARSKRSLWHYCCSDTGGFLLCLFSITVLTACGVLAKETAIMLPSYAALVEWLMFRFQTPPHFLGKRRRDVRIIAMFVIVLAIPMISGVTWLLIGVLRPEAWATRDFTLSTRLLSEARIVADYIDWTLLPTPTALSFYHDDFLVSTGLLTPWTTLTSIIFLAALFLLMLWLSKRQPIVSLGIALFLCCQLLTATIIPLELIYEHRNYFASFGLLLAIFPLLASPASYRGTISKFKFTGPAPEMDTAVNLESRGLAQESTNEIIERTPRMLSYASENTALTLPMALPRYALLGGLILCWTILTALTAHAWGNPLRLAEDLAARAPASPRAQYELGRTYIIYSHYDPASPFTQLAYAPLERAAGLPNSSILPEQALIFMNARMHLPQKDIWWNSLITKLKSRKPTVQDESSLEALTQCVREGHCDLPQDHMIEAFMAALTHPPSPRLLAIYGGYAWNVLGDHILGARLMADAVKSDPNEPAYQITLIRMLDAEGHTEQAEQVFHQLQTLNIGGRLNDSLNDLRKTRALK
jgi:hypothetical protein